MAILSVDQLLEITDAWLENIKLRDPAFVKKYEIKQSRIQDVLRCADEEELKYYYGIKDRSPIKTAACLCYAIAYDELLVWGKAGEMENVSIKRVCQLDNARLGTEIAFFILSNSSFDCAPQITPPFKMAYPSRHFRTELHQSMASKWLTTPGIALMLELILYRNNGGSLCGTHDKVPLAH